MAWSVLENAGCREAGGRRVPAAFGDIGWKCKSIIDELGRLYTQGDNFYGQCGFPITNSDPDFGEYPYAFTEYETIMLFGEPPSAKGKVWKWCEGGESHISALTTGGDLYMAGQAYAEMFGKSPADFGGDDYPIVEGLTHILPGYKWKAVSGRFYGFLGIGLDDKLYTWGYNYVGELGLGNNYQPVGTPTANPYITEDVKLVDTELFAALCVTKSDKVYVFGDETWFPFMTFNNQILPEYYSWDWNVPYEVRIVNPPAGATIIDCASHRDFAVIVYDNGDLYVAAYPWSWSDGKEFWLEAKTQPTTFDFGAFHKVEVFGYYSPTATPWTEEDYEVVLLETPPKIVGVCGHDDWGNFKVIDAEGNIWSGAADAGGYYHTGSIWNRGLDIRIDDESGERYYAMTLCMNSPEPGFKSWKWANNVEVYTQGGLAIDSGGYVYVWGGNANGRLGLGYPNDALGDGFIETPTLAPAFASDYHSWPYPYEYRPDQLSGVNLFLTGMSPYVPPPFKDDEHEICGHWHLQGAEEEEKYENCYMPSMDIWGGKLYLFAFGRFPEYDLILLEHDIANYSWTFLYHQTAKKLNNGETWIGRLDAQYGGQFLGETKATATRVVYFGGMTDTHSFNGDQMTTLSEPQMACLVYDKTLETMHWYKFPRSRYMSGKCRMGVDSNGNIYVAYIQDKSGELFLTVAKGEPGGWGWDTIWEESYGMFWEDYRLAVDPNSVGVVTLTLFIQNRSYVLEQYLTSNGGTSWTLDTNEGPSDWVQQANAGMLVEPSKTSSKLYYSFYSQNVQWFFTKTSPSNSSEKIFGKFVTLGVDPYWIGNGDTIIQIDDKVSFIMNDGQAEDHGLLPLGTAEPREVTGDGNSTVIYAAFNWYVESPTGNYFAIAVSEDNGYHWSVRRAPLGWVKGVADIGKGHDIWFGVEKVDFKPPGKWVQDWPKIAREKIPYAGSDDSAGGDEH